MAVRATPEYSGVFENTPGAETPYPSLPIEVSSENKYPHLVKLRTKAALTFNRLLAGPSFTISKIVEGHEAYIKFYHRNIPSATARLIINHAAPPFLGLAITSGIVALAQANGADQPKPKIEITTTTPAGPKSADDCEAFSSGDDWFHECMKQRGLREQAITP